MPQILAYLINLTLKHVILSIGLGQFVKKKIAATKTTMQYVENSSVYSLVRSVRRQYIGLHVTGDKSFRSFGRLGKDHIQYDVLSVACTEYITGETNTCPVMPSCYNTYVTISVIQGAWMWQLYPNELLYNFLEWLEFH